MPDSLRRTVYTLLLFELCCFSTAYAHPIHTRADSVDGEAMSTIVIEYHRLLAAADSTAYRLLAPAYSSFEMNGHTDPRSWLAGALLPDEFAGGWPDGSEAPVRYENDVEIVHVLSRWNRGIVITHEVGSYREGTWDAYNAWILMRVGDQWRIGASIHALPRALRVHLEGTE
jgi:hypothetical protein